METAMYRDHDDQAGLIYPRPQIMESLGEPRSTALELKAVPEAATPAVISPPPAPAPKRPSIRKLTLIGTAVALVLAGSAWYGTQWWTVGRFMVSTDDAYVRAHNTTLASKIAGYVASIPVEDNAQIHAGDVIATIDDGDYRLAVEAARDKVATQQAAVDR